MNPDFLDRLALHFLGWCFIALCSGAAAWLWVAWKRGKASIHWPTTRGEILSSAVKCDDGSYSPRVEYRYWVDGCELTSDTVTYGGIRGDRSTADSYVARYQAGDEVSVYYDPTAPNVSVLEPGADRGAYIWAVAVLVVLAIAGIVMKAAAMW
jgi:hypothetical protein